MNRIGILENTILDYSWGSTTAIPMLLGKPANPLKPQAELWMGAHPKAPSQISLDGKKISLTELIDAHPKDILGEKAAKRFNGKLPFLFKVLAAEKPLSIQAHPNLSQAKAGFKRENALGIPLSAPNRNYKDDNHKPEIICALTRFWALNGFRKISETLSLAGPVCPEGLREIFEILKEHPDPLGLKTFFKELITIDTGQRQKIIDEAVRNAGSLSGRDPVYEWMTKLYEEYSNDMGVFSPLYMNLVCLEPGQAMSLPAGEIHAYLQGMGIELMANSDNVLRGGLTPKHVDVTELLNILGFEERTIDILAPESRTDSEEVYMTNVEEFVLSVIHVREDKIYRSERKRSAEILLCTYGRAEIACTETGENIAMPKGRSVIVPSELKQYTVKGNAVLYKAACPII